MRVKRVNRLLIVETKENFNQMFGSSVAQARSWAVGASQRGREGGGGGGEAVSFALTSTPRVDASTLPNSQGSEEFRVNK